MTIARGIVDHGAGNLVSIAQGLRASGAEVSIVTDGAEWDRFDGIVLPGVGATATAMRRLTSHGLVDPLRTWQKPLLGICVGLQLLFERSRRQAGRCTAAAAHRLERRGATAGSTLRRPRRQ